MKKKILYIAPAHSIHTYRWTKFFANSGYELFLISDKKPCYDFSFLTLFDLSEGNNKYTKFVFNLIKTIKIIKTINPDLIHAHCLLKLAWIPSLINYSPVIITPWGDDLLNKRFTENKIIMFFSKIALKNSVFVTSDSYALLDKAKELGAKNTELITFGVEKEKFYLIDESEKKKIREKYSIDEDSFVILSPRTLMPYYNIDIILDAFILLAKKYNNIELIILNFGSDQIYEKYEKKLMDKKKSSNLSNKIKFLPKIDHHSINEIYNISNIMVSLPNTDGTPATFFEAMKTKCLVVCNNLNSYKNIFENNYDVSFIDKIDSNILSNKIEYIYNNKDKFDNIKENGLKTAQKNNFDEQMLKVNSIYQNIFINKI
ncbi:MAG: glycosyltransferase [Candidatus Sericytochromatia bacterium]